MQKWIWERDKIKVPPTHTHTQASLNSEYMADSACLTREYQTATMRHKQKGRGGYLTKRLLLIKHLCGAYTFMHSWWLWSASSSPPQASDSSGWHWHASGQPEKERNRIVGYVKSNMNKGTNYAF